MQSDCEATALRPGVMVKGAVSLARSQTTGLLLLRDRCSPAGLLSKKRLCGDSGVGKSSLIMRLTENAFSEDQAVSIGEDYKVVASLRGLGVDRWRC